MQYIYCGLRLMSYPDRSMLAVYHKVWGFTIMDSSSKMVRELREGTQVHAAGGDYALEP